MISFDDFAKVELKTGKVLAAEPVEGSEKLVRLTVDIGEENPRNIYAGIIKWYEPDSLVGKTIIVVANLEARKMMGSESQGMLLAADSQKAGHPIILTTNEETEPGAKIR
jgi:methionyl-tRNA synthetase